MNICIVGWYGTETLGDRAILDGIIYLFEQVNPGNRYLVGSLFPVLTERTIFEDDILYKKYSEKLQINTFNVKNKNTLIDNIRYADMVVMGGGPLMDLAEMHIIAYAFKLAKKYHKPTALLGCGYGPLHKPEYINTLREIVNYSDLIVMRSTSCKERLCSILNKKCDNVYSACDPAILSVLHYKKNSLNTKNKSWIMNIRDLDYVYNGKEKYYPIIKNLVESVAHQVDHLYLMPMHSFSVGGDDRYIQNRVKLDLSMDYNITVIQKPLSLKEAYDMVSSASGCIGMRYHSVVFQSFLNGNNYIIDYTDKNNGKISSFIKDINAIEYFNDRYINIFNGNNELILKEDNKRFLYPNDLKEKHTNKYIKLIGHLMEEFA